MTIELRQTYTIQEFLELPEEDKRYELVKGELEEMPGPSARHGKIISILSAEFINYLKQNNIGEVFSAAAFVIDSEIGTVRIPDLAFVTNTQLVGLDYDTAIPFAPELAIEVISPSDIWFKVQEKVDEYKQAGVKLVWVIFPPSQLIYVYHPDVVKPVIFGINDEIEGEEVLPGFKLMVSEIFK
jgi:Uma2 family endonuclease